MARRHGSKGSVLIDPAGGTTYVAVAAINAWSLDQTRDTVDVTAMGDANKQYVVGLADTKGTFGAWWDDASTPASIFDVAGGDTPVGLKLLPSSLAATIFFSGLAYLDASINVPATGAIDVSGNWVAAGPWSLAP
jgi:hypothetical protein